MAKKNSTKISRIRTRTHEGVDKIIDQAENLEKGSKKKIVHLNKKTIKLKKNISSYIKENPKKSLSIAAGIGAFVSAILTIAMIKRKK